MNMPYEYTPNSEETPWGIKALANARAPRKNILYPETAKDIALACSEALDRKGWSIRDLADKAGITTEEAGTLLDSGRIDIDHLQPITELLGYELAAIPRDYFNRRR